VFFGKVEGEKREVPLLWLARGREGKVLVICDYTLISITKGK